MVNPLSGLADGGMEETRVFQQSSPDVDGMLPPGAALARFEPPLGVHMAAAGQLKQEKRVRYGFRVGDLGLLINADTGSEVLAMPAVASMPGALPGFLGLINLRSNLVPLYELRVLIGIEPRRARTETMVLVFDQGDRAVGVIIEGNPRALTALRPLPNLPPLPDALQDHVTAGFVQDETVWLEFDHGSFFAEASRGVNLQTI